MKHNTNKNKFSFSPLLAVGLFFFLSTFFYYRFQEQKTIVTEQELKYYLKKGHVKKVVLMTNQQHVRVYIQESAFYKLAHQKLLNEAKGNYDEEQAYYVMKIASVNIFDRHYQTMQKTLSPAQRKPYQVDQSIDVLAELVGWVNYLLILAFFLLLLLRFLGRGLMQNAPGGGLFGLGKSKAVLWGKERKINVKLKDVAGMVEEKQEVKEFIDCLKNPDKMKSLGGRIPKGLLLTGGPGLGKTLLAKAIAGEAGVPFYSVSGADFVEVFVGLGASRVSDLFEEARKNSPCVIFIDEIDAIGAARSNKKIGSSNEERENTLNKLLAEMDGFDSKANVIVIAATNRADILDKALRRAGRFDNEISIGLPSIKDREAIFQYHIKKAKLKVAKNLSFEELALQTPGFSGADIANTANQAALLAARKKKKQIDMKDFQEAMDRVTIGLEKKTKVISPAEKLIVGTHEAGHAVAAWFLEYASPLVKVSIIPVGNAALGYAKYLPNEQHIYQVEELYDKICVLLAARAAEELTFGKISTGASDDLKRSTMIAYNMVKKYGMDKEVGHLSFDNEDQYYLNPSYSNAMSEKIDHAVQKIIKTQYKRAVNILKSRKEELKAVADALLKKEVLYTKDIIKLIGKRPFSLDETKKSGTKLIGPATKPKKRKT